MASSQKKLNYDDYTVAIICPLEVEMTAMRFMLDEQHVRLPGRENDRNRYILGKMGEHNVAIGYLPYGWQGIGAAATVATDMRRTFQCAQLRLLVGIGGGIPSKKNNIRLGDVVVGMPDGVHGGVVQYDLGKRTVDGFERKGFLCPPPDEWRTAVVEMKSDHEVKPNRINEFLSQMLTAYPTLQKYARPSQAADILFAPENEHVRDEPTCDKCDQNKIITPRLTTGPEIFYGTIASGDSVIKDAKERDALSKASGGAMCFDMEAAGLSNGFPCVVIRGICDYADSHKNDDWHPYAAATAAACAKDLLTYMDPVVEQITTNTYFDVPRQKVRQLFGREDELAKIGAYYGASNKGADRPRTLVLHAMGGQGKTQVALEYCHRARKTYKGVFWVNSSSISAITQSLVSVAQQLDSSTVETIPDEEARVAFAIRTLEEWEHRWLIVYDNCDDATIFSELQDRFLPQVGGGDILFTTRHRGLEELAEVVEVPPMPHMAGIQLLLHRYRGVSIGDYLAESTVIVTRLGNLALAIDQASAYMQYIRLSIDNLRTFLPKYLAQREKVLQHTSRSFWNYSRIVDSHEREIAINAFTTWEMSFQQLLGGKPDHDNITHFLTLSAFFGQTSVNESIFRFHWERSRPAPPWMNLFTAPLSETIKQNNSNQQGDMTTLDNFTSNPTQDSEEVESYKVEQFWEPDKFWDLVYQAFETSLLQSISPATDENETSFLLHPLIRDWLQLRSTLEERQAYTREAIHTLTSTIQVYSARISTEDVKTALLLHLDAAIASDDEFFDDKYRLGQDISTCNDAYWFALYYRDQGRYDATLGLCRTEMMTMKRVLGTEHPKTLAIMNNLATILEKQGKCSEAEQIHRQVAEVRERVLGTEHPDTLINANNLALVLGRQGKHDEAEKMYRQMVDVSKRVLGAEHHNTLTSMNNLATVLDNLGNYIEAEQVLRHVVEVRRRTLGTEHSDTLVSMNNLAKVLGKQGECSEAEQILRWVIEVKEKVLGIEHPRTINSMNNLATILGNQGKYMEAEEIELRAVKSALVVLGSQHPDTGKYATALREIWLKQDRSISEIQNMQQSLLGPQTAV